MENEYKSEHNETVSDDKELLTRRASLIRLKKWSKVVIGSVLFGGLITQAEKEAEAGGWINRRGYGGGAWGNGGGGGWVNGRGGGGGSWVNRW